MTLAEMKTYFETLLAETSTSSDFVTSSEETDLINEGCLIFGMETKIVKPTYQQITLATNDKDYDLESTFLVVAEGVFLFDSSGNYKWELSPLEEGFKEVITNDSGSDWPTQYTIRGYTKASAAASPVQNIIIEPPPSAAADNALLRIYYAKQPFVLSATTDVSDIPVQFHRGPVIIGLALFKERDEEFEQAAYFWKRANYWINKAKKEIYNWTRIPTGFRFSEGNYVDR